MDFLEKDQITIAELNAIRMFRMLNTREQSKIYNLLRAYHKRVMKNVKNNYNKKPPDTRGVETDSDK